MMVRSAVLTGVAGGATVVGAVAIDAWARPAWARRAFCEPAFYAELPVQVAPAASATLALATGDDA